MLPPHQDPPVRSEHPICQQWTLSGRLMAEDGQLLNVKGVKVGIEAGPFSDDDQIVEGVFRIPKVSLPKDQFIQLYLEFQSREHYFYKRPISNIPIDTNYSSCTLVFQDNLTVPKDIMDSLDPKPPPTFSINLSDPKIRSDIEQHSAFRYDPTARQNKIVVTYDPRQLEQTHFTGYPVIKFHRSPPIAVINGQTFVLDHCAIPDYPSLTGKRQVVENWATDQALTIATAYFKQNPTVLAQWLQQSVP